jgi:hypothetical protein
MNFNLVVSTEINEIVNNWGMFSPGKNTELGFFQYFYGPVVAPQARRLPVSNDGIGLPRGTSASRGRTFRAAKL